jgi:hypothetical protein
MTEGFRFSMGSTVGLQGVVGLSPLRELHSPSPFSYERDTFAGGWSCGVCRLSKWVLAFAYEERPYLSCSVDVENFAGLTRSPILVQPLECSR